MSGEAASEILSGDGSNGGGGKGDGGDQSSTFKAPEWMGELSPETLSYVESKGKGSGEESHQQWNSPGDLVDSYRNLERMVGGQIKIPDDGDEKAWESLYGKLGRPDAPDGYTLGDPVEGLPEGMEAWYKDIAHGMNLNDTQAKYGYGKMAEYVNAMNAEQENAIKERDSAQMTELRNEWGAGYDAEISEGKKAAKAFGFSADEIDGIARVIGVGDTLRRFAKMGHAIGEHTADGGGGGGDNFSLTKEQASARKTDLLADKSFKERYLSGEKQAVDRINALEKIISS